MKHKIVIHMGFHKTGSTSIQEMLLANKALMTGVHVLNRRNGDTKELTACIQRVITSGKWWDRFQLIRLCKKVQKCAKSNGGQVTLITDEALSGFHLGQRGEAYLYSHLSEIVTLLADGFAWGQPEFVFYTKEHKDWLLSTYKQSVRENGYSGTFDAFCKLPGSKQTLPELIAKLKRDSPGLDILNYEMEVDGLIGRSLLNRCDIDTIHVEKFKEVGRENVSAKQSVIELVRRANASGCNLSQSREIYQLAVNSHDLFID